MRQPVRLHKTDFYIEVEHNGTTFQIPKQSGEMLYIRLLNDETTIIQIEFPEVPSDPTKLAMRYNIEPGKIQYVSDEDLQNIGEALTLITNQEEETHVTNDFVIEESDSKSIIS